MTKKDKILHSYIFNILDDEKPNNIEIVTKQDISKLLKRLDKTDIKTLTVSPKINEVCIQKCDLYIVLDDMHSSETDIGMIKNLLSQKIVIFTDFKESKKIDEMMLKLGFQKELRDKTNNLKCYSYNLKTYNNKRTWNNSQGWANPENFDKFRW